MRYGAAVGGRAHADAKRGVIQRSKGRVCDARITNTPHQIHFKGRDQNAQLAGAYPRFNVEGSTQNYPCCIKQLKVPNSLASSRTRERQA